MCSKFNKRQDSEVYKLIFLECLIIYLDSFQKWSQLQRDLHWTGTDTDLNFLLFLIIPSLFFSFPFVFPTLEMALGRDK